MGKNNTDTHTHNISKNLSVTHYSPSSFVCSYVTDGGVYSHNVGRVPDLPSARELIHRVKEGEADR